MFFERLLIKISQKRDTQPRRQLHQYIRARCGFEVKHFPQTQTLARGPWSPIRKPERERDQVGYFMCKNATGPWAFLRLGHN